MTVIRGLRPRCQYRKIMAIDDKEIMDVLIEEMGPYKGIEFEEKFNAFWGVFKTLAPPGLFKLMPPQIENLLKINMMQAFATGIDTGITYTLNDPKKVLEENKEKYESTVEEFKDIIEEYELLAAKTKKKIQ